MSSLENYLLWNTAIASVIFSPDQNGQEVFLDFDEEELLEIGQNYITSNPTRASDLQSTHDEGIDASFVEAAIGEAVREILVLNKQKKDVFSRVFGELNNWVHTQSLEPPPTIALMTVLSLAAEKMSEEEDLSSQAFYPRLKDVLQATENEIEKFQDAYTTAERSTKIWSSLGQWLDERLMGTRGWSTAQIVGSKRHIGWAYSQALIRDKDRESLQDFFIREGFDAFNRPDDELLIEQIDDEVRKDQSSIFTAHLRKIWLSSIHDVIKDQVLNYLESFINVGVSEIENFRNITGSQSITGKLNLCLISQIDYMRRHSIKCTLSFSRSVALEEIDSLEILIGNSEEQEWQEIQATQLPYASGNSILNVCNPEILQGDNGYGYLLDNRLEVRCGLDTDGSIFEGYERKQLSGIIPLKEEQQFWIETSKPEIHQRMKILVREDLLEKTKEILSASAAKGWVVCDQEQISGLPAGWFLIKDVCIVKGLKLDNIFNDPKLLKIFECLVVTPQLQVSLIEGLKIPHRRGSKALYHLSSPPQLLISAEDESTTIESIEILKKNQFGVYKAYATFEISDVSETRIESNDSVLHVDLVSALDEPLQKGTYEIIVKDSGRKKRSIRFELQSANTDSFGKPAEILLDPTVEIFPYQSTEIGITGTDIFSVVPSSSSESVQHGADQLPPMQVDIYQNRRNQPDDSDLQSQDLPISTPGQINKDDLNSDKTKWTKDQRLAFLCPFGIHALVQSPHTKTIRCSDCERVFRKWRTRTTNVHQVSLRPLDSNIAIPDHQTIPLDTAFDALCYLSCYGNAGEKISFNWFRTITSQVFNQESQTEGIESVEVAIRNDQFIRNLEIMGFVNTQIDDDFKVVYWAVNSPTLIKSHEHKWLLTGFRNHELIDHLKETYPGFEQTIYPNCPSIVTFTDLSRDDLTNLTEATREITKQDLQVAEEGVQGLLSYLPTLSDLSERLPSRPAFGVDDSTDWYNPSLGIWESTQSNHKPGAYRTSFLRRFTYFQNTLDIENGTMRLTDVRLAKYLAHSDFVKAHDNDDQKGLISYEPAANGEGTVYVPTGADVPKLYGRVLALEAGRPPEVQGEHLQYPKISEATASKILGALNR